MTSLVLLSLVGVNFVVVVLIVVVVVEILV